MGLRDEILKAEDLPRQALEVPEWGVTVYVRAMTGKERDLYEGELVDKKDQTIAQRMLNMRARLVVLCTVDEKGKRVFNDGDIESVSAKSAKALNRIVEVAEKLNALSDAEIEDASGN